ncbi:MAG TPA: zf-HC2 domain-containing protein [Pyrinomonadaceae bacterium]
MSNCLDTGTIQAFLDGELVPAAASGVSAHIAMCDACAGQLAAAEEESSFVISVLEREIDALVPTQRLWSKINDSIAVEKATTPFWTKAWNTLIASLANPAIAVAAIAVIALGVSWVVFVDRTPVAPPIDTARSSDRSTQITNLSTLNPTPVVTSAESKSGVAVLRSNDPKPAPVRAENIAYSVPMTSRVDAATSRGTQPDHIPGEQSYIKTIASLDQTVNGQKDSVMKPSERISYERDMAVVDDAIAKMRKVVQKNPKNESAKQVLYTSYQNKIDLLNSVSQREELVASLSR